MENYVGKICPYCKSEIKDGESVTVCPSCSSPHHSSCWDENKGCTTFGCSEQNYQAQGTSPTGVCDSCGTPLGDEQMFCPKCGKSKTQSALNSCSKCGNALQENQEFCSKCGQKVGVGIDGTVNSAINQFNQAVNKSNTKQKKKVITISIIGVTVVGIILIALSLGGKTDFNDMYSDIANETWCEIGSDGTWMSIDTNPYDLDDHTEFDAYFIIETINDELGFSSSLWNRMGETSSLDGRQDDETDKYTVSWKYHPNNGMEVTYEVKE